MNETTVIGAAVALLGLALGSFLNVCIFRIPAGESIITPRSHCPQCGKLIAWCDNIPLLSFILLGAKCRHCKAPISVMYPLVEALTAGVLVLCYLKFHLTPAFIKASTLSLLLILVIFTDLTVRRIPHPVTMLGMSLGLVLSLVVPVDPRPVDWLLARAGSYPGPVGISVLASIAGALAGGGLFYAVGEAFYRLTGKEGLGFGDVMMMLMVGTFLGVPLTLFTILCGSVLGTLVALPLELFHSRLRRHAWPFGSFLGIGALIAVFWGPQAIQFYLHWSGLSG
jgi:leader peptidase (prepilin peptidase)/N-methyltransferase